MKPLLAPAAIEPMMQPSISRCGFFCISRRSLKVPGSDSSALQQRYLSIEPLGMKLRLLAHREAGAAAAAQARRLELLRAPSCGVISSSALRSGAVAAEALVDVDRVQAGLVDVARAGRASRSLRRPPAPRPGQRLAALLQRGHELAGVLGRRAVPRSGRRPRPSAPCRMRRGTRTRAPPRPRGPGRAPPWRWRRRPPSHCAGGRRRSCRRRRSARPSARCAACRRRWPRSTGRPGVTCMTAATWAIASGEHQPCTCCAARQRGQRGRVALGVLGHVPSIVARSSAGTSTSARDRASWPGPRPRSHRRRPSRGAAAPRTSSIACRRRFTGRSLRGSDRASRSQAMKSAIRVPSRHVRQRLQVRRSSGRACARARAWRSRRRRTKQPSSPRGDSIAA